MAREGKWRFGFGSARLERFLELVFDATLPFVAVVVAILIYCLLAAELNTRAQTLVEWACTVALLYGFLRHLVLAANEGSWLAHLRIHRFGATLAMLLPIYLVLNTILVQPVGLGLQTWDKLGFLLKLLFLLDLFSAAFYRLLVFLSRHLKLPPPLMIVTSFALVISIGTLFLMSPRATPPDKPISFVDALFTSTSATCVTGLAVRDTGQDFTPFGHAVLFVLIQIGGLGLMTFASFFAFFLGQGLGIKEGIVLRDSLNLNSLSRARPLLYFVLKATLTIELLGAVFIYISLGPYWKPELSFWDKAWASVFHSVSAFCNAGFATFPKELVTPGASLEAFTASWPILTIFSLLIIFGGLGFLVQLDILETQEARGNTSLLTSLRRRGRALYLSSLRWLPVSLRHGLLRAYASDRPRKTPFTRQGGISVHTWLVLWSTVVLTVIGFVGIVLFEWGGPIHKKQSTSHFLATAAFQSVTTRTAGFNSVPYGPGASWRCPGQKGGAAHEVSTLIGHRRAGDLVTCPQCGRSDHKLKPEEYQEGLSTSTLFLMISLMFIGASPGSTGGGTKTVTVAILFLAIVSLLRKREDIEIRSRSLSSDLVNNAAIIVFLAFLVVSTVALILTWSERGLGPCGGDWRFIDLLFESVSAVATVGLSTGVTGSLSTIGRVVIICAMFFGRIGPMTLVLSLAFSHDHPRRYKYPKTAVMIG